MSVAVLLKTVTQYKHCRCNITMYVVCVLLMESFKTKKNNIPKPHYVVGFHLRLGWDLITPYSLYCGFKAYKNINVTRII